jgi:IS30 family transposase
MLMQGITFSVATDVAVYFADSHTAPGSAAATKTGTVWSACLFFFPKAPTGPSTPQDDLDHFAALLNDRPREALAWDTPAERFNKLVTTAV